MKCRHCKSDDLVYDELSEIYRCCKCNALMGEDEVILEDFDKECIKLDKEEEKVANWEDEDLNGLSLVVLNLLSSIPILNFLIPIWIANSNVKIEYKKQFGYRCLQQVMVCIFALFFFMLMTSQKKEQIANNIKSGAEAIMEYMLDYKQNAEIRVPEGQSFDYYADLLFTVSQNDLHTTDNLEYLDNVIMNGEQCRNLMDSIAIHRLSYLVHTNKMKTLHGNQYRCFGTILSGCEIDASGDKYAYYISSQTKYSLLYNDYGDAFYEDWDDVANSRYTFYMDKNSNFIINAIYNFDDELVGFKFTEME